MYIGIYKKKIQQLAKDKVNEMFFNVDVEHATIVLTELIRNADNYVYIIGKNMDPAVTDNEEYLKVVEGFLQKKDTIMKILLTNYDKEIFNNSKIGKLLEKYKNVEIKHSENKQITREGDIPVNFTVSDDRAFRFERDVDKCIAFGNFNDEETAPFLAKKFNEFFEQGACLN